MSRMTRMRSTPAVANLFCLLPHVHVRSFAHLDLSMHAQEDDDDDEVGEDEYEEDDLAEKVTDREAETQNRQLDAERRKEEEVKLREQVRERYEGKEAHVRHAEDDEDEADRRFQDLPDATRDPCASRSRHPHSSLSLPSPSRRRPQAPAGFAAGQRPSGPLLAMPSAAGNTQRARGSSPISTGACG